MGRALSVCKQVATEGKALSESVQLSTLANHGQSSQCRRSAVLCLSPPAIQPYVYLPSFSIFSELASDKSCCRVTYPLWTEKNRIGTTRQKSEICPRRKHTSSIHHRSSVTHCSTCHKTFYLSNSKFARQLISSRQFTLAKLILDFDCNQQTWM